MYSIAKYLKMLEITTFVVITFIIIIIIFTITWNPNIIWLIKSKMFPIWDLWLNKLVKVNVFFKMNVSSGREGNDHCVKYWCAYVELS